MDDNQLFALFWKCAATCVAVIAITAGGCTSYSNKLAAELAAKSSNPALVQCSVYSDRRASAFCIALANQK